MKPLLLLVALSLIPFGPPHAQEMRGASPSKLHPDLLRVVAEHGPSKAWVFLRDKGLADPVRRRAALADARARLSPRALERRRARRVLPGLVDERDVALARPYVEAVLATGVELVVESPWLNALSVRGTADQLRALAALECVTRVEPVRRGVLGDVRSPGLAAEVPQGAPGGGSLSMTVDYGSSLAQLTQIGVVDLHARGHAGAGVVIGILDTGFHRGHEAFQQPGHLVQVLAEHDFVAGDGNTDIEAGDPAGQHSHGTYILGTLAAYLPGSLVGAAYDASFILCKTEDVANEYQQEEDFYVAGLQFIEANGGDLATSSLGYIDWYTQANLDGATAVTTLAVNVATDNGMPCVTAAGNAGHDANPSTSTLIAPADALQVITAGAVDAAGGIAGFSSSGPTADGRVKPELLATGVGTWTVCANTDVGCTTQVSGTSLSTPLLAGLVACLLDAHPDWTVAQLRARLLRTGDYYRVQGAPDPLFVLGYGIPDGGSAGFDCNGNGIEDALDIASGAATDCNGNGYPDSCDLADGISLDVDADGIPDECGGDCDGDGLPDELETDCDANGVPDDCETLSDCDGNGIPDVCEGFADCNANGIPDACELDCNANGVPDDCEALSDCNADGIPDECQGFTDCNANGIPDVCEPDCDGDGLPDGCEVDCDANGVPDECEAFADCNANGVPDVCDPDANGNGLPDECESTDLVASGELPVQGTVGGSFLDTHAGDGVRQSLREVESGGRPASRTSLLEHKWTLSLPFSSAATLFVRAHHTASTDGDDFVLAWSSDDVLYTDLLTVTKTADDGGYQSAGLPASIAGPLWIRVRDTSRAAGGRSLDTLLVDHLFVRSTSIPGPPSAPSGLTATAVSSGQIDLAWLDGSADESGFELERSTDGVVFAPLATLGPDVVGYSDTGLASASTYTYRVRAFNDLGSSGFAPAASATTLPTGASDAFATGELSLAGTVTGSVTDTWAADGVYEVLQEITTGGKASTRVSYLEHKWTFAVAAAASAELHLVAHRTASSEGDAFVFAWSADDVTYTDVLTLTATTAGASATAPLPALPGGTVWIRVRDTDRTAGNRALDSVRVDQLFLRTQ